MINSEGDLMFEVVSLQPFQKHRRRGEGQIGLQDNKRESDLQSMIKAEWNRAEPVKNMFAECGVKGAEENLWQKPLGDAGA
jgi:hypothetical protein